MSPRRRPGTGVRRLSETRAGSTSGLGHTLKEAVAGAVGKGTDSVGVSCASLAQAGPALEPGVRPAWARRCSAASSCAAEGGQSAKDVSGACSGTPRPRRAVLSAEAVCGDALTLDTLPATLVGVTAPSAGE